MKKLGSLSLFIVFSCVTIAQSVTIGTQVWMTKNLDVSTFRNGDPIPQAKTEEEWEKAGEKGTPVWCYYENDSKNGEKYGKIYNWYAVIDPRGLSPKGWHVPTDEEWTKLTDYLGGEEIAGAKMKSISGWKICRSCNGTNSSGFTGLPGGIRDQLNLFFDKEERGFWWSSTETEYSEKAWARELPFGNNSVVRSDYTKNYGMSVRCLKD